MHVSWCVRPRAYIPCKCRSMHMSPHVYVSPCVYVLRHANMSPSAYISLYVSPDVYISLCVSLYVFPSCACFPLCVFPFMVCIRGWCCNIQAVSLHSSRAVGLAEDWRAQTHGCITCIQWTGFGCTTQNLNHILWICLRISIFTQLFIFSIEHIHT
jgi:hypothetical protein